MKVTLMLGGIMLGMAWAALMVTPQAQEQAGQAPPPARKIPGITVADPFPNACVDCHIHYVDMKLDTRFRTLMHQWNEQVEPKLLAKAQASAPNGIILKGKHPKMTDLFKDIPAKCLVCHGKGSTISPPFANLIHNIHLVGGEQNHFLTMFQGECTYCHKLDQTTGHWTIPSAAEK